MSYCSVSAVFIEKLRILWFKAALLANYGLKIYTNNIGDVISINKVDI